MRHRAGAAGPHQAFDLPAGGAERLGGDKAEPARCAQNEDTAFHRLAFMNDIGCCIRGRSLYRAKPGRASHGHRPPRMLGSHHAYFMSHYLVPIAIGAVAIVLVLGLVNMMRGGSPNRSQKLMRLRVLLQFVAIIVIMAAVWGCRR